MCSIFGHYTLLKIDFALLASQNPQKVVVITMNKDSRNFDVVLLVPILGDWEVLAVLIEKKCVR